MTEQQASSEETLGVGFDAAPTAKEPITGEVDPRDADRVFTVFHRGGGFAVPVKGRARRDALIARGTHTAEPPDGSATTRRRARKE